MDELQKPQDLKISLIDSNNVISIVDNDSSSINKPKNNFYVSTSGNDKY